ncbi:MAG: hypothetical protein AMJ43_00025 [Coxiella sp. DG_40]|nr:MAG: hypothetical protein AMJ43_00025 [Coxiella sp. DG_40]
MNIVLDTNIIYGDWYLSGINFGLLEKYLKQSDAKLFVPEIIVSETKNLFKKGLTKLIAELVKNIAELHRYLPEEDTLQELPDIDEKCNEYNAKLDKRLAQLNAERPGYSNIPHDSVVARALAPRKPFKEKDTGYRDTLLWEVILRKIATKDTSTFLISNNHKDFANKPTDRLLHSDLIEDLVSVGLPKDSVQFYYNLKSFVDGQVKSKLKVKVDDTVQSLKENRYEGFSFTEWFNKNREAIAEKLNEKISIAFTHVYRELEDPTVTCIEELKEANIEEVNHYEDDEQVYYIGVSATLTMTVDFFVDKAAYYSGLDALVPLDVWDSDWNEWVVWAVIPELELSVSFSLLFDTSEKTVDDFEVNEVDEIWGWCRFCQAQIMSDAAEGCWSCGKSFG